MEYEELVRQFKSLQQKVENMSQNNFSIYEQNDKQMNVKSSLTIPIKETNAPARLGEIMCTSGGVLYVGNASGSFSKVGSQ